MNNFRVAWLVPIVWFYWQPVLREFSKIYPQTIIFTGLFSGYAPGFEDSLKIELVGETKIYTDSLQRAKLKYGSSFTYNSPKIIGHLFQFRPQFVFTSSFGIWTLLAILLKPVGGWKVAIAYEGSALGVDFLNSPFRLWLRKLMVKAADSYITNTQKGKAYLIETLQAKPERVFAQPYEIPAKSSLLNSKSPIKVDNLSQRKPIFLFVGRITPRKGLQHLLKACLLLNQQEYSSRYTLLIIGDGEQRSELESFCHNHGLEHCVQWIGRVDYREISAYFEVADVFVFPTLRDTWGVVTLEAMLLGKPVLCSANAGSSEMVSDGENGYVFEPHQPEKLADLMANLIDNPELVTTMGIKSQELISMHTPEKAAQVLARVIN